MVMPKPKVAKKATQTKHTSGGGSNNGAPHQKILNVLAAMKTMLGKDELPRKQVATQTGIMGKSTFANALTKLKKNEWIVVGPGTLSITPEGMKQADPSAMKGTIPTSNEDHRESIKKHHKFKAKAIQLFDFIDDGRVHKKKDVVAAINNGKSNSTFANALTELKKANAITFDRETVRLHDDMFPFEPRPE